MRQLAAKSGGYLLIAETCQKPLQRVRVGRHCILRKKNNQICIGQETNAKLTGTAVIELRSIDDLDRRARILEHSRRRIAG